MKTAAALMLTIPVDRLPKAVEIGAALLHEPDTKPSFPVNPATVDVWFFRPANMGVGAWDFACQSIANALED